MTWTIEYLPDAQRDFKLIFDHLVESYQEFGDAPEEAIDRARQRMLVIRDGIGRLGETPFIGTLRNEIYSGLRFVRRNGAAIWFMSNDQNCTVLVIAIFFGGQDHMRRILGRLIGDIT